MKIETKYDIGQEVWAQCAINGQYRYCALYYDTFDEAKKAHEGQVLDIEKTRFSIRNHLI